MSLMRRLLGKSPEPDPEKYARVRCEACAGTGWLMSGGEMYLVKGMSPVCSSCDGTGEAIVAHEANALTDV
jgi:DnaJ-class molecular chaperone